MKNTDSFNERLDAILDRYARMDDMARLSYKREQTARRLKASRKRMTDGYNRLIGKAEGSPATTMGKLEMYLDRFVTVYQGARLGMKIFNLFREDKKKR